MELITIREKILGVVDCWKEQYPKGLNIRRRKITEQLSQLDLNTASAEDVNEIIGNDSWTSTYCDECQKPCGAAVMLGEHIDYESPVVLICLECLKKAFSLFNEENNAKITP